MKDSLEQLKSIRKVNVDENLYNGILLKIKNKENKIQMFWVKIAAVFLICLFSTELLLINSFKHENKSEDIELLSQKPNNMFYYE